MKKVKDLFDKLEKMETGIDEYFNMFFGYGLTDKQDDYDFDEIMNWELTRELLTDIKEFVMGYFDNEGDSIIGELFVGDK